MLKNTFKLYLSSILLATLFISGTANAAVIYSSLDDGFDDWLGYVEYDDFIDNFGFIDNINPTTEYQNNFMVSGSVMTLLPTEETDGTYYYIVGINKTFALSELQPNQERSISISSLALLGDFYPGDPLFTDNVIIRVTNLDTNEELVADAVNGTLNPTGTDIFDITSWGSATIEIDLLIADFADEINSSLAINEVSITVRAMEVDAPSTLSIAVLLFFISRLRTKKRLTI